MNVRWWRGVAVGLVLFPAVGRAQILGTGNVATESTQVANYAALAMQLVQQAQQIQLALRQLESLGPQDMGQFQDQLARLDALARQGDALAYNASNLNQQFAQRYPGYDSFVQQQMGPSQFPAQYSQWSRAMNAQVRNAVNVAGAHSNMMREEQVTKGRAELASQSAVGTVQAQQATNLLVSQEIEQMQKLRQLLMTQIQLQSEFLARWQAESDAREAATKRFNSHRPINYTESEGF